MYIEDRFDYLEFPGDFTLPENYLCDQQDRIYRLTEREDTEGNMITIQVVPVPILIEQQYIDAETHQIHLVLLFRNNEQWKRITVPRSLISSTGRILQLSDYGIPVHSGNARNLIEYLHAFEAVNKNDLPTHHVFSSNGWKTFRDRQLFVTGQTIIYPAHTDNTPNLIFRPEAGFEHLGMALHSKGSYDTWKEAIQSALQYPKVAFGIYASFAVPLLSLVNAPNFIVHYWGSTSTGKTTTLSVASSVWGRPEQESGGLIMPWNTTAFYAEQTAIFFNDLPIFKDDCQAADDALLSHTLYLLSNRIGRGRGAKGGNIQASPSWQTICLSTGEKPLSETTTFHGAKARTIELEGSPFGDRLSDYVNTLKMILRNNYGHAGSLFLEALLSKTSHWQLQHRYVALRDQLAATAQDEIGDRMSHYFAVIWLAAELVEQHLGLTSPYAETIPALYKKASQSRDQKPLHIQALQAVLDYVQQHQRYIAGKAGFSVSQNDRWGVWREHKYLALRRDVLTTALEEKGFAVKTVLDLWQAQDYIKRDDRQITYTISHAGRTQKMIVIKWHAIHARLSNTSVIAPKAPTARKTNTVSSHQPQGQIISAPNLELIYYSDFFNPEESTDFFEALSRELHWQQRPSFDLKTPMPRLTAFYGDQGLSYTYSRQTYKSEPWTPTLLAIKAAVEKVTKRTFNAVLGNLYRDGKDSVGWHADDEPEHVENSPIASVSFGETRQFILRHNDWKEKNIDKVEVPLSNGSLLIMAGETQYHWQHSIPKSKKATESRINLTFRCFKKPYERT